jgi:Ni/Fe-hydrogenase subunit HybB-like protein
VTLWVLVVIGLVSLLLGIFLGDPSRAWQVYLVNFLFWSSLAQGGIIFSAAYRQTNGGWGEPIRRLAESMIAFLPVSFVLFLGLLLGYQHVYSWAREPVHGKELWLSAPFLFTRDGIILLVLFALSAFYFYHSQRPDLGRYRDKLAGGGRVPDLIARLTRGWRGAEIEEERSRRVLGWLTPLLLVVFVVLYSFIAFDLVMSIDPHWYSTLFGWFYDVSTFYLTLAGLAVAVVIGRRLLGLHDHTNPAMFHDLGKLLFGFCLLTGGFFWTRYLVIWYGNLTEEIGYVILRMSKMPWAVLSWSVVGLGYALPLAVLLSRAFKKKPMALLLMGTLILVMMWLERFVAIAPSVWQGSGIPLGLLEIGVTAGFAALFALSWLEFARLLPLVPIREESV